MENSLRFHLTRQVNSLTVLLGPRGSSGLSEVSDGYLNCSLGQDNQGGCHEHHYTLGPVPRFDIFTGPGQSLVRGQLYSNKRLSWSCKDVKPRDIFTGPGQSLVRGQLYSRPLG